MEDLIKQVVSALNEKGENTEVAVFFMDGEWWSVACNPSPFVMLGEASGKYQNSEGKPSAVEALSELLELVAE